MERTLAVETENLPTRQAMRPRTGHLRAEVRKGRRQDRSDARGSRDARSGYTRRES